MTHEANDKLILNEVKNISSLCRTTLSIVESQPSRHEVKLWIREAVQNHEKNCDLKSGVAAVTKQSSENTGIIRVLMRSSIFPKKDDSRAIRWAKILVPAFITLVGGSALANHFIGFFN